jgi:hypothetical protein
MIYLRVKLHQGMPAMICFSRITSLGGLIVRNFFNGLSVQYVGNILLASSPLSSGTIGFKSYAISGPWKSRLAQEGRLSRERVGGHYLYCSRDADLRRDQLRARQVYESDLSLALQVGGGIRILPDELKAAIILFFSLLDEKQRRLYAGLESLKIGHGGDQRIAELLNLDVGTVARGRKQLLESDIELDRVRKSGGGRPTLEKKHQRSSEKSKN